MHKMSLTLSVLESDCQLLWLCLLISKVSLYRPHPCPVTACTGQQFHLPGYCREREKRKIQPIYVSGEWILESSFRHSSQVFFLHAVRGNDPRYEAIDVVLRSAASTCLALLPGIPWFQFFSLWLQQSKTGAREGLGMRLRLINMSLNQGTVMER